MTLYRTKKTSKGQRHVLKTLAKFCDLPLGQQVSFITKHQDLFRDVFKGIRFEAIIQPLYTSESLAVTGVKK